MTYDPALQVVVLVGGVALVNGVTVPLSDTWVWDGSDWTQETAPGLIARGPRQTVSMDGTFDHTPGRRLLLFGGLGSGGAALGDTMIYSRDVSLAPPTARACNSGDLTLTASAPSGGATEFSWQCEDPRQPGLWFDIQEGANRFLDAGGVVIVLDGIGAHSAELTARRMKLYSQANFIRFRTAAVNPCGRTASPPCTVTLCMADLTCDGGVNVADYLAFLRAYSTGDAAGPADLNGDGQVNVVDYLAFLRRFAAGCP
jgi:hypothetical protein